MGKKAAKSAASTQAAAAREGLELQEDMWKTTRRDLAPWKTIGSSAINELGTLVGGGGRLVRPFGREDFREDPGYQFRVEEGRKGIENSAAARGMQLSGAALKGLERFRQGTASDEYSRAWGRDAAEKDRQYNYLTGLSGQGMGAASMTGQFGANFARSGADLLGQAGNARAAGTVGGSNALTGAAGNISNYLQLKNLLRSGGGEGDDGGVGSSGSWGNLGSFSYDSSGRKGY